MGVVVPQGKIAVTVALLANLSSDLVFKPFSINPDVAYGVMPKLDVGIYHSPMGITGFWDGAGGGICVAGEDNGCADVYDGPIALLANYELLNDGKLALAANGGLNTFGFDPFTLALKLGVNGMFNAGKVMVGFAPNIFIGLTERDFNKEILNVPVSVGFAATPQLKIGVQTGIRGPLDGFGDAYTVPVSLGAMFAVNESIGVAANFGANAVVNGFDADAFDSRTMGLWLMWRN
jgi:hypothetical protein